MGKVLLSVLFQENYFKINGERNVRATLLMRAISCMDGGRERERERERDRERE